MSSVIGRLSVSARLKSSSSAASSALPALASPNCSMRRSGCARWAAATACSIASTRVLVCSYSPGMENVISAERPSLDTWFLLPLASGDSTLVTYLVCSRRWVVSLTASVKLGSVAFPLPLTWTRTCSSDSSGKSAAAICRSAVRESPLPPSSSLMVLMPIAPPRTNAITTNASHPKIAVLRWWALQWPARAASVFLGNGGAFLVTGLRVARETAVARGLRHSRPPAFGAGEPHRRRGGAIPRSVLLALGRGGGFPLVLVRLRRAAVHDLARPVRVLRRRVDDHVLEVEQRDVGARSAIDVVLLAVTGLELVVPVAAVQRVAGSVVVALDVGSGERPEDVIPVLAERLVDAAAGIDQVVPGPAVLLVVSRPAAHEVVAVLAVRRVVAVAAPLAVTAVAAVDRVVAAAAPDAVEARQVTDIVGVPDQGVIALIAQDPVIPGPTLDAVVAAEGSYAVISRRGVDHVGIAGSLDAVVPGSPVDLKGIGGPCHPQHCGHRRCRNDCATPDYIGHCPTSGLDRLTPPLTLAGGRKWRPRRSRLRARR